MDFGLWGTADPNRVAVTRNQDEPGDVLGFVAEISNGIWKIDGDPIGDTYPSPASAAAALIEKKRAGDFSPAPIE